MIKTSKSFKQYINEARWKISELMAKGAIPLSYGMMSRLGYTQENKIAFHLMNSKNLKRKYKEQNTKTHISCFTKGSLKLSRLPSNPNILIKVQGISLIDAGVDIYTEPSDKNRRWITAINTKLQKFQEGILFKSLDVVGASDIYKNINIKNTKDQDKLSEKIESLDKPTFVKLYRTYLSLTEKWLDSGGYLILNDYTKTATNFGYDEVVLTRWQILEVYDINYPQQVTADFCKKKRLDYQGYVNWEFIEKIGKL